MYFVNERLRVVPGVNTPEEFAVLPPDARWKVRNAFLAQPDLIGLFVEANPFSFHDEDLEILSQWKYHVAGKFFIVRYLRHCAVFLVANPPTAYGVLALTDPFEKLLGQQLPIVAETVLLPFKGKIVYDGIMVPYRVSNDPGIGRDLDETYEEAKEKLGIVTSLPMQSRSSVEPKKKKVVSKSARTPAVEAEDVVQIIIGAIQEFCRTHLNEEYEALCCRLAEKLARKRPSPLLKGQPNAWAAAILRTIGRVNFLDDPEQTPHLKLKVIDEVLGTKESTSQQKSKQICGLFRIQPFSSEWTLPSQIDDNPLVWMLEINGLIMDIRDCPRELQEAALAKGLIPYIPADQS
jgi:hypothetical protein